LTEYTTRQLDLIRSLDYQTCPGEDKCESEETGVIFTALKYDPGEPIDAICGRCKLLETKPGQEPPQLTQAIVRANELDALRSAGATFAYPDALTPFEWACIAALQAGRNLSEANAHRERQAKAEEEARRADLEQKRRRGR